MTPLSGVVVHDIQDDLDARLVQRLHHRLELAHVSARCPARIPHVRRKEADGVVSPIVGEVAVHQVLVDHELMDGEQLHRRDPQPAQIVHHRGAPQAGVRPPQPRWHVRIAGCESLHVHLVDDGLVPGNSKRPVVAPGEGRIDHQALGEMGAAIPLIAAEVGVGMAHLVPKQGVVPVNVAVNGLGIRIEEQLCRVESLAVLRVVGSVDAISVAQAGSSLGEVYVPGLVSLFRHGDASGLLAPRPVR